MKKCISPRQATAWCTAFLLLLCLILCPALAEAPDNTSFSIRGGITWATTPGELEAQEDEDKLVLSDRGDVKVYMLADAEISKFTGFFIFAFNLDQPLMAAYLLEDLNVETLDDYTYLLADMTQKYGQPTCEGTQKITLITAMNIVVPDSMTEEDLTEVSFWTMDDGTLVCVVNESGDGAVFYINGAAMEDSQTEQDTGA